MEKGRTFAWQCKNRIFVMSGDSANIADNNIFEVPTYYLHKVSIV